MHISILGGEKVAALCEIETGRSRKCIHVAKVCVYCDCHLEIPSKLPRGFTGPGLSEGSALLLNIQKHFHAEPLENASAVTAPEAAWVQVCPSALMAVESVTM